MNYPVTTAFQLRSVLRSLRRANGLSQAQVGQSIEVNQKRIATIENAPGVTGFDQIARLIAALGGRLVVEIPDTPPAIGASGTKKHPRRKAAAKAKSQSQDNW